MFLYILHLYSPFVGVELTVAVIGYKSLQYNRRAPIILGRHFPRIILNHRCNRMYNKLRQMLCPDPDVVLVLWCFVLVFFRYPLLLTAYCSVLYIFFRGGPFLMFRDMQMIGAVILMAAS